MYVHMHVRRRVRDKVLRTVLVQWNIPRVRSPEERGGVRRGGGGLYLAWKCSLVVALVFPSLSTKGCGLVLVYF